MNLTSHAIERLLKLPPPSSRALIVQRDLRVPMADGVELLADRWAPREGERIADRVDSESVRPTRSIRCSHGQTAR